MLLGLPGVRGMEIIAAALNNERSVPRARTDRFRAAIRDYADLVARCGGSQKQLLDQLKRLRTSEGVGEDPMSAEARARHTASSAMIAGGHARVLSHVYAARLEGKTLHSAAVRGLIGLSTTIDRLPIAYTRLVDAETDTHPRTLEGDDATGFAVGTVIGRLSSAPLPVVTTTVTDRTSVELLDTEQVGDRSADVFIGSVFRSGAPTQDEPHHISLIPRVPSDRLLIDVLLDRRLSAVAPEHTLVYNIGAAGPILNDSRDRWYDRIAELRGPMRWGQPDERSAGDDALHDEARRYLLEETGWNAEAFDMFRLDVRHPIWSAQHVLTFQRSG
ncbi:MAG: hypothetical protein AAGB48_05675 [Planctomycetota bacterium]